MIEFLAPALQFLADGADAGGAAGGAGGAGANMPPGGGLAQMLPMLVGVGLIFYFMIIRPGRREKQEREQMLAAIKKGDRIVTKGGLIGRITEIREREYVVKVDETNNTRVHVYRTFVLAVLGDEKDKEKDKELEEKLTT